MWRSDPTLCDACGLSYESHANDKCLYNQTVYTKAASEIRWYGVVPGMTSMRYAWVCYACRAIHEDDTVLPIGAHDVICRLPGCGKRNFIAAP